MILFASPAPSDHEYEGTAALEARERDAQSQPRVDAGFQHAKSGCSGASTNKLLVCPSNPRLGISALQCFCQLSQHVLLGTHTSAKQGRTLQDSVNSPSWRQQPIAIRHGRQLQGGPHTGVNTVVPNMSLNRTRYGRPPWPGLRYAVHCLSPGQGVLPPRAG